MLQLPEDFQGNLSRKFESALSQGDLIFGGDSTRKTEIVTRVVNDEKFDIHFSLLKSLEKRPEKGDESNNPFENPEPELTVVSDFGENDEFRLVLNKYPVVSEHFMLITKQFRSQNTPLSPSELLATFSVLAKLKENEESAKWFAFYNCGLQSGASQPHKHVQFMKLPSGHESFAEKVAKKSDDFIPSQMREPLQDTNLPFAHFVAKLPAEFSEDTICLTFYSLVQRMLNVFKDHANHEISYNFCATMDYMMLVPRSVGKFENIGINSCAFMGLALCKSKEVYDTMKTAGFENILRDVGYPTTSNCPTDEYHYLSD